MKKIIFTIVGSMMIGLGAVQAQQTDTTGAASDRNWKQQSEGNVQSSDPQALVIIDVQEVPSNIKQKLDEDDKYEGWEKATVYHNTITGDYIIVPQPFSFDSQGNEKEMSDMGQSFGYHTPDQSGDQRTNQSNDQRGQYSQQNQYSQQSDDPSAQEQAQSQMGEIPTTAPQPGEQDTSAYSDQSTADRQQSDRSSQSYRVGDMEYNIADMIEVETDDIPSALRTTLEKSEYEGWEENGTLYRNPSTSEFVLIMDKTNDPSQAKTYRFDASGQPVDDL